MVKKRTACLVMQDNEVVAVYPTKGEAVADLMDSLNGGADSNDRMTKADVLYHYDFERVPIVGGWLGRG